MHMLELVRASTTIYFRAKNGGLTVEELKQIDHISKQAVSKALLKNRYINKNVQFYESEHLGDLFDAAEKYANQELDRIGRTKEYFGTGYSLYLNTEMSPYEYWYAFSQSERNSGEEEINYIINKIKEICVQDLEFHVKHYNCNDF